MIKRIYFLIFVAVLMMVGIRSSLAANAVVGTGTPASCTQTAFNTALATAQSGGGTITFNCGLAAISFTAQKVITSNVVIDGGGLITLSGGDVTRLFWVQNGRSLTLRNIILTDGYSGSDYGGAIYVENGGTLTLDGSTIQNSATNGWAGGAIIDFGGTVTIKDSTIANNLSSYGAINSVGIVKIVRSTIMSNTATIAGGALSVGGEVTIQDSHLHHNNALNGGAMFITSSGDVSITGSTFKQNRADGTVVDTTGGGAILSDGFLSITSSTFEDNVSEGSGGAIQSGYQTTGAELYVFQTAVIGNQAVKYGGGIYNAGGTLQLINSTLSENLTQESGGGLTSFLGPATLIYVTAVNNIGGNLNQLADSGNNDNRQRIILDRTAVAGGADNCQVTGTLSPDPLPYFVSQDYNLSSDDTCTAYLMQANDINNTPALLDPLADNGGVTLTHLPQAGSPLIDTAVCQPDFLVDQRDIVRPQNGLCDIGAVEVGSNTTGPTPTSLPSATAVPSPTPQPTPTLPSPGAPAPAFSAIRITGGVRPTINLTINHAYGGQAVTVSGTGATGYNKVRIFSVERGQTVGAVETAVINNSYQANLFIPYTMPVGVTQLCAAAVGAANGELACTPFTVDPMPNGSAAGQIQGGNFGSWHAQANLIDTRGRLVQTTPVDNTGAFQFNNVPPGIYQYAFDGTTDKPVAGGSMSVFPGASTDIPDLQVSNAGSCTSLPRSSYLLLDRKISATSSPNLAFDPYASVVVGRFSPLASNLENISPDWSKFQREKFGYYVTGVHHPENFIAIPQVNGAVQKVMFYLRNADGSLADNPPQTQNLAPYTAVFDMGKLKPSSANGDPYIEVVPYVAGQAGCAARFPVQVIEDPMIDPAFRKVDSRTTWNKAANVYQFSGVIPNITGLPLDFPVPPYNVPAIPHFGRFQNKADAGIYVRGVLTEDGMVWMEAVSARAELKLMSVPLINPKNFDSPPIPNTNRTITQLGQFSFKLPPGGGRFTVLPPIEVGIPFVETPVFNLLGIDFVMGTSAKAGFTAYLNGEVYPFQPRAVATLTPSGYGEGELTVGTGLIGLVSAGGGLGFRLQLDVPISVYVPEFKVTTSICPTVSSFVHLYARALIKRANLQKQIASYSPGCYPLSSTAAEAPEAEIPLPDYLAAPSASVAVASDGRALSAYVEDTAVSGTPHLQIMARFQDSNTGIWQTATAVSDPTHAAGTPVVGFAGSNKLPLIVWVADAFNEDGAPTLVDDFNAQVNRQDLFYSWYENGNWQTPVRLTHDLFADGMPSLASSSTGALLTWVRDMDSNPQTQADQRIAVAEFNATTRQFGEITLLTGGATGLNAEPQTAYDGSTPVLVWTYDSDADLETAVDRHLAIARKENGTWAVSLPPNLPAAADSPTIVGGQNGVTLAFLVREPDEAGGIGFLGTNGAVWTARRGNDTWHATPLRGTLGEFVYGERPLLATNQSEILLAFRRFGEISTHAGLGQLSLSTAQGMGSFAPPIYLTDENQQFWQLALALNPVNKQAILVHVERPTSPLLQSKPVQQIAATEGVMQTSEASLNTAADPVVSVSILVTADPALTGLQVWDTAVTAGDVLTVTAVLRNIGRNPAQNMTVKLYNGTPGSGSLLGTKSVNGPLLFNKQVNVDFAITAVAGTQNLYAEVTTSGENISITNDRAFITLGNLTAPFMHEIVNSGFTPNALDISWYPASGEHVNSYRVLRRVEQNGPFELIGESVEATFTDTLAEPGGTYCYAVQSYNGAFHLSEQSDVICAATGHEVFLPMIVR